MLRPVPTTPTAHRQHVTIDGRIYLLTQWPHLQALANNIECPESSGWAFGDVGDRRYAAWYGGAL